VTADQRDALIDVAGSQRPAVPWEGSIWTAGSAIGQPELLRHAMIAPRLVAPHPNAGVSGGLSPEQAVAMLMQARLFELDRFAEEHVDVPDIRQAGESDDWRWRFAGALEQRLTGSGLDPLTTVLEQATSPPQRVAAAVAVAAAYIEQAQCERALGILEQAIARDDAAPADHGWLLMQRARASAEIGQLDSARADALTVVGIRNAAPHDATATALAGAGSNLLFATSAWGEQGLEQAITGSDTAATWWRQQATARGLDASLDRNFKRWARDGTKTIGGTDDAHNELFAASLLASNLGSQGAWRHLAQLTACDTLLRGDRHTHADTVHNALSELRVAGASKELTLAATRASADGPAAAVTLALADVDLVRSTRTTARADLALIKAGGDVADGETANRLAGQLVDIIESPGAFFARTTGNQGVAYQVIETLAGVALACDDATQTRVREHILTLDRIENQVVATGYARVLKALSTAAWNADTAARAREVADSHHGVLRLALLGVATRHDQIATDRLIALARGGSLDAIGALGDVRKLPADIAAAMTAQVAELAQRVVADAHEGQHGIEGADIGASLAVLNAWHPTSARWDELVTLLDDDAVLTGGKVGALRALASLADRVPDDTRERLIPIAQRIAEAPAPDDFHMFINPEDAPGEATRLLLGLGALDSDATATRLCALLAGEPVDRRHAARVAARINGPERLGVLAALSADAEPTVRAAAADGLAAIVASSDAPAIITHAVEACIDDPGTRVPAQLGLALRHAGGETANTLLGELHTHRSAFVRSIAADAGT
jgi:hypothetical protein